MGKKRQNQIGSLQKAIKVFNQTRWRF